MSWGTGLEVFAVWFQDFRRPQASDWTKCWIQSWSKRELSAEIDGAGENQQKMKQEWEDSNPRPAVLETAALPD
jgi:hypothetical protein